MNNYLSRVFWNVFHMFFICFLCTSGGTSTSIIQSIRMVYNFAEATLGLLLATAATSMLSEGPGLRLRGAR